MPRKTAKHLEDIRDAAEFIGDTLRGRTLEDYRRDRMVRQAVERNLEIIGEAVNRLVKDEETAASELGDYRRIIAFRNVLAYGYDLVDDERVWQVIQESLPVLKQRAEAMLSEVDREG